MEIEEFEDMTLLDTTNAASAALDLTKDHFPDVVILDLELNTEKGNGLDYLSKYQDGYSEKSVLLGALQILMNC